MKRPSLLVIVVGVATSACALLPAPETPKVTGEPWAATYERSRGEDAPVCKAERTFTESAVNAMELMCGYDPANGKLITSLPIAPIDNAIVVATCASACDPAEYHNTDALLAAAADPARRVDDAQLETALAASGLPSRVQTDFMARFRAARTRVTAMVAARDEHWREVFLQPAIDARSARASADAKLVAWNAKAKALIDAADRQIVARDPSGEAVTRAIAMRRDYVAECVPVRHDLQVCLSDAVGRGLTQVIQRLAEVRHDLALSQAEAAVLGLDDRSDPRTDEGLAAEAAFKAEKAKRAEWEEMRKQVSSESALKARWPVPPYDLESAFVMIAPVPPLRDGSRRVTVSADRNQEGTHVLIDQVRAIERAGERATIQLRRDVIVSTVGTNCRKTDRIVQLNRGGEVVYETECGGSKQETDDRTEKPVNVPWTEAHALRVGEVIAVVIDLKTRRGNVVWSGEKPARNQDWRDFHMVPRVQLREFRMPAPKRRPAQE